MNSKTKKNAKRGPMTESHKKAISQSVKASLAIKKENSADGKARSKEHRQAIRAGQQRRWESKQSRQAAAERMRRRAELAKLAILAIAAIQDGKPEEAIALLSQQSAA